MSFELHSERQAYVEVLAHELKKAVRMIRAFPSERFEKRDPECARTARELAVGFVTHAWRIDDLTYGRSAPPSLIECRTRGEILLELETAAMSAVASLSSLPSGRWGEVVEAPPALLPWRQARRGELLWLALRELVRHDRHFALHLKAARVTSLARKRDAGIPARGPGVGCGSPADESAALTSPSDGPRAPACRDEGDGEQTRLVFAGGGPGR